MGYAEKVFEVIHNGEIKIQIQVFANNGSYNALMLPVASGDARLMSHFKEYKIRQELGETIELAIAACKTWIKANLWQDVIIHEKRIS